MNGHWKAYDLLSIIDLHTQYLLTIITLLVVFEFNNANTIDIILRAYYSNSFRAYHTLHSMHTANLRKRTVTGRASECSNVIYFASGTELSWFVFVYGKIYRERLIQTSQTLTDELCFCHLSLNNEFFIGMYRHQKSLLMIEIIKFELFRLVSLFFK